MTQPDAPTPFDVPLPLDDQELPARPYLQDGAPSAGYARGADTSKAGERARAGNQSKVLLLARQSGRHGITGKEAAHLIGKPESTTAQACLSVLHMEGLVLRLTGSRRGHKIYVTPEHLDGRATEARGFHGRTECPHCGGAL